MQSKFKRELFRRDSISDAVQQLADGEARGGAYAGFSVVQERGGRDLQERADSSSNSASINRPSASSSRTIFGRNSRQCRSAIKPYSVRCGSLMMLSREIKETELLFVARGDFSIALEHTCFGAMIRGFARPCAPSPERLFCSRTQRS